MTKTSAFTRSTADCLTQALLLATTLCAFSAQAADQAVASTTLHPIVSTWSWTLFGGKCRETFQYRADNTMLSTSAGAATQWTYNITASPDAMGFYKLVEKPVKTDGKKDCSGDVVDVAGSEVIKFIQMSPTRDRFIACKDESLDACFGPLGRIR